MRHPYENLPIACATRHPVTNAPILIQVGQQGYWPLPDGTDPDKFNKAMNVTPAQLHAMEVGAIFGFDVPGANPDFAKDVIRRGKRRRT
jgi:hypothetical protein